MPMHNPPHPGGFIRDVYLSETEGICGATSRSSFDSWGTENARGEIAPEEFEHVKKGLDS